MLRLNPVFNGPHVGGFYIVAVEHCNKDGIPVREYSGREFGTPYYGMTLVIHVQFLFNEYSNY